MAQRRAKLDAVRARGENPFPTCGLTTPSAADPLARYAALPATGHAEESVASPGVS